jgi:flavin reductase (DIM6/NTAB) family NADH-FMN oxidoreductase RutF
MSHNLRLVKDQTLSHSHLPIRDSIQPTVTTAEFKNALAEIAYTVAIVTACNGQELNGRTITSVIPLSVDPPRLLISIDTTSRMVDLVTSTKKFSVSMLSCGQQDIADVFSGKVHAEDRFESGTWTKWPSGTPRLTEAVLSFDLELVGSVDMADHILFVGAVLEAHAEQSKFPLLWANRTYAGPTEIHKTHIN